MSKMGQLTVASLLVALAPLTVVVLAWLPLMLLGFEPVESTSLVLTWIMILLPGILALAVASRLILVYPLVVDRRMTALQAFRASWISLRGQTIKTSIFLLVTTLLSALGALICGVGILITLPVYPMAISYVYKDVWQSE